MQGVFVLTIEFLDGRPPQEVPMPLLFPDNEQGNVCMKLLASINMTGGILEYGDGEVTLLPLHTLKSIKVKEPVLSTATLGELAAVTGGKIKLA